MRKSREDTAASRQRIIGAAAGAFRERGLAATSIADVMAAAGMTHGGFYKHFPDKAELEALAVAAAFGELQSGFSPPGPKAKSAYVRRYLSAEHLRHPGQGCPVAALGGEGRNAAKSVKAAFRSGMEDMIGRFIAAEGRKPTAANRAHAIRQLALMAGAVVVARAAGDDTFAEEVLEAARAGLTKQNPRGLRPAG